MFKLYKILFANDPQPQLSPFRVSDSTLFLLMTNTYIGGQLYVHHLQEVVTEEENFIPTPQNQNQIRLLRINPL